MIFSLIVSELLRANSEEAEIPFWIRIGLVSNVALMGTMVVIDAYPVVVLLKQQKVAVIILRAVRKNPYGEKLLQCLKPIGTVAEALLGDPTIARPGSPKPYVACHMLRAISQ